MVLWSIQRREAWHILKTTGVLRGDAQLVDADFLPAYQWLCKQMTLHIGSPPMGDALPVWAWYQWQGERKRKPDLRSGHVLPKGEHGVRIELKVNDHRVLLSDYVLWRYVLGYTYIPVSEDDHNRFFAAFEARNLAYGMWLLPNAALQTAIVASWQRIFDLDWEEPYVTVPRTEKCIQATLWELCLADVTCVQEFVAC